MKIHISHTFLEKHFNSLDFINFIYLYHTRVMYMYTGYCLSG